jgi:hypothetical protein
MSGQPNGTDSSDVRIDRRAFVRWTGGGLLVGAVGA